MAPASFRHPRFRCQPARRAPLDTIIVDRPSAAAAWARAPGRDRRVGQAPRADEVLLTLWDGNDSAAEFYRAIGFRTVNVCLARGV